MAVDIHRIIEIVEESTACLQRELLDCLPAFPWKEIPESWFQMGFIRHLNDAGYKSYPEYWRGHVLKRKYGKVDIAVFEPEDDFHQPQLVIEVKGGGASSVAIRNDATRLCEFKNLGTPGILVHVTFPIKREANRAKLVAKFATACRPMISRRVSWTAYEKRYQSMPEAYDLDEWRWGVLIATTERIG